MHRAWLVRPLTLAGFVVVLLAPGTGRGQATPRATTLPPDLARTVDAEVRVAMFELASGAELPALSRLERAAELVRRDSSGSGAAERAALHFMLAQSYYRMGMLAPFRREAEASIAAGPSRYAALLRPQLVIEAYRAGDYTRAATLARDLPPTETSGIGSLVAGLAAYQSGDLPAARAAFQRASSSAGLLGAYAKYMDAIAQLRADTTQAASVVATLESIASSATAPAFAEQVRLTAAQVAFEGERYEDAVRLTATIADSTPLAAPALLTRAWSLYKLERVDDAERAFADFVTRYPNRPERDEANLMVAQAQLELGRSVDAEQIFQRVADSASVQVGAFQAQTNAAIAELARALVADRAAELLIVSDPVSAKTVSLRDSSVAALPDTGTGDLLATLIASPAVEAATVGPRLDSIAARTNPTVARVLFTRASATTQAQELAGRSQSLVAADAAVAVARYRLAEQLEAQEREIALLARLAIVLDADSAVITDLAASHQVVADSLARLELMMSAAEARLRQMLGQEVQVTRQLAAENSRIADSLRTALLPSADADGKAALDAEVATAASYARIAEMLTGGLDNAIAHHPAFVARDSLRAHDARARSTLASLQGSYGGSRLGVAAALSSLRGGDAPATSAARQALRDAEGRRTMIEGEVIAAVSAELSARANAMMAGLQRSTEAAQFGTASAAFFRAIDGTRAVGGAGTAGATRSAAPERRR